MCRRWGLSWRLRWCWPWRSGAGTHRGNMTGKRGTGRGTMRFVALLILTTIAILATSCVRRYMDVGPVFVTSDPKDVDMHYVVAGSLIIDPNNPGNSLRVGKDGRWMSNKFFEYLLRRAVK